MEVLEMEKKIFDSDNVNYDNIFRFDMETKKVFRGRYVGMVKIYNRTEWVEYLYMKTEQGMCLLPIYNDFKGYIPILQRKDLCEFTLKEIGKSAHGHTFYKFRIEIEGGQR